MAEINGHMWAVWTGQNLTTIQRNGIRDHDTAFEAWHALGEGRARATAHTCCTVQQGRRADGRPRSMNLSARTKGKYWKEYYGSERMDVGGHQRIRTERDCTTAVSFLLEGDSIPASGQFAIMRLGFCLVAGIVWIQTSMLRR